MKVVYFNKKNVDISYVQCYKLTYHFILTSNAKENNISLSPIIQCWIGEHLFNAYLISVDKGLAKVNPICNITGPYAPSPSFIFLNDGEEEILKGYLKNN